MNVPNQPPSGAQPPRKSHTGRNVALGCGIPAGVVVVLALFGGCMALVSAPAPTPAAQPSVLPVDTHGLPTASPATPNSPPASTPKTAKVGDPVKVGDFEITVTGVEDGVQQIGPDLLGQTADGQYVLVSVEITNNGDQAAFFNSSSPKLYDADDKQYSTAPVIPTEQGGELYGQVNPGNTTKGKIVFDVPQDVEPTAIEFSGGLFATPVTVGLS